MLSTILQRKMQLVLQSEISECGLACLTMMANFHGHRLNLIDLRSKYEISRRGANVPQLMRMAGRLQLETRPIKCEVPALGKLRLPAILHWNMNHYVVLNGISKEGYEIFDPAAGRCLRTDADMDQSFTGIALEVWPKTDFKPEINPSRFGFKQYLGNFYGFSRQISRSLMLSTGILALSFFIPALMQILYHQGFASANRSFLATLVLGLCFIAGFQVMAEYVRTKIQVSLGLHLSLHSASSLFSQLMKLPLRYFESRSSNDIATRFGSNESLKNFLLGGLTTSIIDGLMAVFMLSFMLLYSLKMTLIAVAGILLAALIRFLFQPAFSLLNQESIVLKSKMQGTLLETLRSMQSVRLYQGESTRQALWQNEFVQSLNNDAKTAHISLNFHTINQFIGIAEKAAIIALGASMVMSKDLTPGMFIAFISYKDQFSSRVIALLESWIQFRLQFLHLDRIADIALTPAERPDVSDIDPRQLAGSIAIHNLEFRHDEESRKLFQQLNLQVEEGENIAIVGPSGQGKSSLLKLILGLFNPSDGEIFIGGYPLASHKTALQSMMGTVMQEDQLISGTIADNIALFDSNPNLEKIHSVAALASIHEDILALPMGYNSLVGEQGSALSGGQQQRILIARALYRNPRILLLDEATSHLDSAHEKSINTAIRNLRITRLIVAHRRETILSADRIFRLEEGKLKEIDRQHYLTEQNHEVASLPLRNRDSVRSWSLRAEPAGYLADRAEPQS